MAVRSLNKVIIIGNLTRDPELRYTAKGTPICSFGVATNREWTPAGEEEKQEATEFHNVVAWSKLGELCSQLLFKGRKVYIEGRLQTRSWEDSETGKRMYRTEIVARDMIALGAPRGYRGPVPEREEEVQAPTKEAVEKEVPKAKEEVEGSKEPTKEKTPAPKEVGKGKKKASGKSGKEEITDEEMPF